jgi:hypothetical protein
LFPAYRSFPETFANDHSRLYVPWSIDDAITKLMPLLMEPHPNQGLISDWTNGTIDRIVDIMQTAGTVSENGPGCSVGKWFRGGNRYRDLAATPKYELRKK